MKVLLVNGSPHKTGCTHTALNVIADQLHEQGIETEELWCGVKPVMGCIGCGKCKDTKRCWYDGDGVNEFLAKVPEVDAFVFGSPIHFAGTSGSIKPFMDRAFCSKMDMYAGKPGAAIVSCRRGGAQGGFEGKWYVSDPTNNGSWLIDAVSSYAHLLPSSFDVVLAKENGIWYNLSEYQLNICHVAEGEDEFVVPFSINGYQVTSFNPSMPIASNIRQINIGKNITTLGENYVGLEHYADNVEYIEVDPENTTFASYLGVVYRKAGGDFQLTHIPSAMKCVELMPMNTVYKNTIYNHKGVEVLIIAPGTKNIEPWGIENCPNLKIAYVPEDVEIANNAFYNVHSDFQIIRGDYTNIPQIKED